MSSRNLNPFLGGQTIKQLLERIDTVRKPLLKSPPYQGGDGEGSSIELILAFDQTPEGESTSIYLAKLLKEKGVRVSRLARGLPTGSDLNYADELTLTSALSNRREI